MINPLLTPRLNYDFSLFDLLSGLSSVNKDTHSFELVRDLFNSNEVYFTNHARTGLKLIIDSLDLPNSSKIGVQAYTLIRYFNLLIRPVIILFFWM